MTPEEARQRVLDFVYGEMSPDEAARFQTLVANDASLRAEVEAVQAIRDAASEYMRMPLPVDVRAHLLREAARYARKRAGTEPAFWSFLERFLLSPAFTGVLVVVVALGAGVHLLLEMGPEDRLTRIERMERVAVSEPESAPSLRESDHEGGGLGVVARRDGSPSAQQGGRPGVEDIRQDSARTTAETRLPGAPAKGRKRSADTTAVSRRSSLKSDTDPFDRKSEEAERGSSLANHVSHEAHGPAATTPAPQGYGEGSFPRLPVARATGASPAADQAVADARRAPALESEVHPDQALEHLARARHWKSRGMLDASLTAYGKALRAGTLTGEDLFDALAEATEVAIALKRWEEARTYLERLKTLPGGPSRAVPLERSLPRPQSE